MVDLQSARANDRLMLAPVFDAMSRLKTGESYAEMMTAPHR
jgi:hypothetical protein